MKPVAGALVLVLLASSSAAAGDEAIDQARALYREGIPLLAAKKYEACYEKATAAWALAKNAPIAGLRADCALGAKRYKEAVEAALAFLEDDDLKTKPEDRRSMERVRDEAKKHVALVRLVVSPADAHVVVDGKPFAAGRFVRDPGPIELRATAAGRPAKVVKRTLAAGDDVEISVTLGDVTGAEGNDAGAARPVGWKTPVAATAISLGAAGVVVGAVLMGLSVSRDQEGDALRDDLVKTGLCPTVDPTRCEQLLGIRKEQDLCWNVGLPTLITGGVLAVGGVVVAVVPLRPSPKPAVSVEVRVAGSGAVVRGSF